MRAVTRLQRLSERTPIASMRPAPARASQSPAVGEADLRAAPDGSGRTSGRGRRGAPRIDANADRLQAVVGAPGNARGAIGRGLSDAVFEKGAAIHNVE